MNVIVLILAISCLAAIILVATLGYIRRERTIEDFNRRIELATETGDTVKAQLLREELHYYRVFGESEPRR